MSGEIVLIVEDDPVSLAALAELLRSCDYGVVTAENGAVALELLQEGPPPAVILLDIGMPVMDGWEFMRLKRADPKLEMIPVIVVTGLWGVTPHGAVATVHKPINVNRLLALLDAHT